MLGISVRAFLDLEAIVAEEEEEEYDEGEDAVGYFVDDDEPTSDGASDDISLPPLPGPAAQDLEDEARRFIVARAGRSQSTTSDDDVVLPFRVPREDDPSIWSVGVKLGRENDVVFQICRRCLVPSETHPPTITSAFARSSIPGHVFIEALDVADVRRAVDGLVTIRDKQPRFIEPTEYVGILSWCPHPSSQIEKGQWVCCRGGRYRDDVGYVCEPQTPMSQWVALVAFVPRIPQPGGKRKRDGRPAPWPWTIEELTRQHGEKRVKVLGPGKFSFRGCLYEDGLAFEFLPWSLLRVMEHSSRDITPFARSTRIRNHPAFAASLKRFTQDSIHISDRILVVSGEHNGIIGRIGDIRDNVADVIIQIPAKDSGLITSVMLRHLIPYFLAGDYVKIHWSDSFGMVIAVDHDTHQVTFLDRTTNIEIKTSALGLQFYNPPPRFFQFTPGLHVEFPGKSGATRRGIVVHASGNTVQVIDEMNTENVDVNRDDITVSGVQAAALPKPERNGVWVGHRIFITRGHLKGYRGLVKAEDRNGVDVELDAMLASHGPIRQRFKLEDVHLVLDRDMAIGPSSRSDRTPPPEDLPRAISPEPEEREEGTNSPWSLPQEPVWKHWLFADEIQERLREECIPFHVRGIPTSSSHAKIEGLSVKTVPIARQKAEAQPGEVVVSAVQRGRPTQISLNPTYLVPWPPSKGNKVLIVGWRWIGQVGKLVEVKDECCSVELESSGEILYIKVQDVVNLLRQ